MSRTWPTPANRLLRCGVLVLLYLYLAGRIVRGWIGADDEGTVSLIVQGLMVVPAVLVVRAAWRETLTLTDDAVIVENFAGARREVPLAQVELATARLGGVRLRLADGEQTTAAAVMRVVVNPWRRKPRPSEETARLINEAVRRERLRRLLTAVCAVQQGRSGR
ncbi:hypothetical protein [Catellatospora coxensis]|uniref:hypothetical protein n=1 Tax=Catellatospora coxensis TaxID=310354 RepID=UPI0031D713D1